MPGPIQRGRAFVERILSDGVETVNTESISINGRKIKEEIDGSPFDLTGLDDFTEFNLPTGYDFFLIEFVEVHGDPTARLRLQVEDFDEDDAYVTTFNDNSSATSGFTWFVNDRNVGDTVFSGQYILSVNPDNPRDSPFIEEIHSSLIGANDAYGSMLGYGHLDTETPPEYPITSIRINPRQTEYTQGTMRIYGGEL